LLNPTIPVPPVLLRRREGARQFGFIQAAAEELSSLAVPWAESSVASIHALTA
jgi:hypothetical protein